RRNRGTGREEALVRLSSAGVYWEISPGRGGAGPESGLLADASGRDFTVNAIYYDPLTGNILDPLGGLSDLAGRRLVLCSPEAAENDPLRLLRAMVLISRRSMTASGSFLVRARSLWPLLEKVSRSRLWPEWRRWSMSARPHLGLTFLKESRLINAWPALAVLEDTPQNRRCHPEGSVWNHTVLCVQAMSRLDLPDPRRRCHLMLAALLHDIGKPLVLRFSAHGSPITQGHAQAGVPAARKFLRSLTAPELIIRRVARLVRWHMELAFKDHERHILKQAARKLAPDTDLIDLWAITAADWDGRRPRLSLYPRSLEEFLEPAGGRADPDPPLLPGRELLEMGFEPGPNLGRILDGMLEAQDLGQIRTPEEARQWVRNRPADRVFE
ncbi:MAG: HD domain-containing protein, partial [Deltaproteobacteria bacterium]|nr:HD domain-containing protein [Deltaproteobacteria bacterium]